MADEQDATSEPEPMGGEATAPEAAYPTGDAPVRPSTRSRAPWFAAVAGLAVVAVIGGAVLVGDDGDSGPPVLSVTPGGRFEAVGSAVADAGMSSSMGVGIEYVLDVDLPDLGDTGTAYRLVRPDLSDDDVVRLAAALGADGTIQEGDGTRVVSDDDRSVEVVEADGSWYVSSYQGGSSMGYAGSTETTTAAGASTTVVTTPNGVPVDGPVSEPVPAPTVPPVTRPADLPSEGEAEDIARGVLSAAGVDGEWRATVSEGSAMSATCSSDGPCGEMTTVVMSRAVTLELVVDGATTGITWYVDVGDRGVVTSTSGMITEVDAVGDYPLRTTADVYDDLVAGDAWYGGPMTGYAAGGGEKFTTVGSAISADSSGASAGSAGSEGCTPEECGAVTTVVGGPDTPVSDCATAATDGCDVLPVCDDTVEAPVTTFPADDPNASDPNLGAPEPATDPVPGVSTSCAAVAEPMPDPMPVPDPVPAPVVHVTGAERSLVQVPGVTDGVPVTWLLPAYRFLGNWELGDDWYADLPAIDEAYLDIPDPDVPVATEPGTADDPSDPGDPGDPGQSTMTTMSSDGTSPPVTVTAPPPTTATGDPSSPTTVPTPPTTAPDGLAPASTTTTTG